MKNSFSELGNNILTRKFGGTKIGVADPYLTGYHFIWFDYLPPDLYKYTKMFFSWLRRQMSAPFTCGFKKWLIGVK